MSKSYVSGCDIDELTRRLRLRCFCERLADVSGRCVIGSRVFSPRNLYYACEVWVNAALNDVDATVSGCPSLTRVFSASFIGSAVNSCIA